MKQLYSAFIFLLLVGIIPQGIMAQCTCSGGLTPDSVVYTAKLSSTSSPSLNVSFPKFNPALGTLTCLSYKDTISSISTTFVKNVDSSDQEYIFRLTVTNTVTAPGINVTDFVEKYYGPDSLKASGTGVDSVTYGPDTTFNRLAHNIGKTSGLSSYLGAGNVTFTYNMSGGLISFSGGLNFSQLIRTTRWGSFKLAYYWCPNSVLASNLKNFTLNKKEKSVVISWNTNATETNTYEIEISTDGKNYSSVGNTSEPSSSSGSTSKYQYEYNPDQVINGTIFVRIKVTDAQGKVTYSEIRSIEMNKPAGETSQSIFPNPAINGVTIKSKELLQGDYEVALVNTIGQTVFNKTYRLDKTTAIKVEWAGKLNTGVYYLKVKDLQHQTQTISKLFIK